MFCKCGAYLSKTACIKQTGLSTLEYKETYTKEEPLFDSEIKYLPERYKENLIETHKIGTQIIENEGYKPEPFETALLVEEYRWFWKPKKVKFVFVAESHVTPVKKKLT
jgi:hypothetical protein